MCMKRKSMYLCALALLLAACQAETFTDRAVPEGEGNVTFRLTAPEALEMTRATLGENSNSARGGITNVDFDEYDLRYQLAVYRIDGSDYVEAITPQIKVVDSYEPVTYSLRLTPNRNYQVVVWADFVRKGETGDLHYNTSDFREIKVASGKELSEYLNDESRDAYFISQKISVDNEGVTGNLILKRPFAKVRVVMTDWNYGKLEMPDNFKVSYYGCKRFVNIDPVTGESEYRNLEAKGSTNVYTATINKSEKDYALNYDESEHNRTILVDYLMTDKDDQTPIHFTLEALDGTTSLMSHDLQTDIPIQRNWLTTIIGNIATVGDNDFTVSIDEGFENEWTDGELWWNPNAITLTKPEHNEATNTYYIRTCGEFAWLSENVDNLTETLNGCTISIENDIDMSGVNWKPICPTASFKTTGEPTTEPTYTVKGNGHTLRNFTIDGKFGAVYVYEALGDLIKLKYNAYTGVWGKFQGKMSDLTFENISINGLADDEVHYDSEGNQIPHDAEYAYFAGPIGYVGQNWSTTVNLTNVHAKHVQIKASDGLTTQNIGGLIGWIGVGGGDTWLKECSAEDVYITGYQAGGLVGQLVGGRGCSFTNCWTENVEIRMTLSSYASGFIGSINNGAGSKLIDCIAPANVSYLDDETGEIKTNYKGEPYIPQSSYYGYCGGTSISIETEP